MISFMLARPENAPEIHAMQVRAFMPLLERYQDADTSPAAETVDRVRARITDPSRRFFFIDRDAQHVGAICIRQLGDACVISPIFILPEYQGQGIAQQSMLLAETLFPQAKSWKLATILQENRNCHLYEKLGYVRTGEYTVVNERMTLIGYIKHMDC